MSSPSPRDWRWHLQVQAVARGGVTDPSLSESLGTDIGADVDQTKKENRKSASQPLLGTSINPHGHPVGKPFTDLLPLAQKRVNLYV